MSVETRRPPTCMGVVDEAFRLEREGKRVIHLEKGELDVDTADVVKARAIEALQDNRTRYSDSAGLPELRQAICDHYALTYGVTIAPDQVIVHSGSSPAMLELFLALLQPGDEVILPDPGYPAYPSFVEAARGRVVRAGAAGSGFVYTADVARPHLTRDTRAVLINFPSNPVGAVADEAALRGFAELGPLVVADEVYHGLEFDGVRSHSILEFTDNAVVVGSFSKAYAMTGWRLGYLVVPRSMIDDLVRLHQYVFVGANTFVQWAAIAALQRAGELNRALRDELLRRRDCMLDCLRDLDFTVPYPPRGGFYVLAQPPGPARPARSFAAELLERAHVAVTPGPEFGPDGEGYVRFSLSSPVELILEAKERISAFLAGEPVTAESSCATVTSESSCATAASESSCAAPAATCGSAAPAVDLRQLTGWRGDQDYFRFEELDHFDPGPVVDVLRGRLAGVIYRGVIDRGVAGELVERFWDSPARKRRGGEVCESLGYYVGAYHYHKPTRTYIDESAEIADYLDAVLDVPREPSRWFREELGARLAAEGVTFRLAEKDGRPGCRALIRHWNASGEYALQPHEDASQCRHPDQADFEIQGALNYVVAAVNMCLENGQGGRLVFWNMVPDDESKSRLGLSLSGSPYPTEVLDGLESIWLDVGPGDIYVFNGGHVHGVESSAGDSKRTTLAWNMGFCNDRTVVSWT